MHVYLFVVALRSPAGKGLTYWIRLWRCHFPIGILGQVWRLIVSNPDLCPHSYFYMSKLEHKFNISILCLGTECIIIDNDLCFQYCHVSKEASQSNGCAILCLLLTKMIEFSYERIGLI